MTFQERLKAARGEIKLTQAQIAEQSGVSTRSYQGYEDGRSLPCADAIAGLVQLGINANWLLTGEGPMLLKDVEPAARPVVSIDDGLLALCIQGIFMSDPKCPPDKAGRLAVQYYHRLKAMNMEDDAAA